MLRGFCGNRCYRVDSRPTHSHERVVHNSLVANIVIVDIYLVPDIDVRLTVYVLLFAVDKLLSSVQITIRLETV